ncbi:MAG TPA: hypothetical protein VE153_05975, partial [Myxococcus sp.]|nr:hypothetical protein [Myxococcus sp.]
MVDVPCPRREAPSRVRPWALLLAAMAVVAVGCATPAPRLGLRTGGWDLAVGADFPGPGGARRGVVVPAGWPHLDSPQEVLAPFLSCASPAGFVALQRGVDMPRLVESLPDWDAVRLGALGPLLDARASAVLGRKRAAFLVSATEKYGLPYAELFALFLLHSAFDDEVRELLALLARDRQLETTLGRMATVREELERRGLGLTRTPERQSRAGDVLRGLGQA